MKVNTILKKIADYLESPDNEAINKAEFSDEKLIITTQACIDAANILKNAAKKLQDIELQESLPDDYETCEQCGYDHSYEPLEANKWHSHKPDFKEDTYQDELYLQNLDNNYDEFSEDLDINSRDPEVAFSEEYEEEYDDNEVNDFISKATIQDIKTLGSLSRIYAKSDNSELKKQAALFDELLLTIATPKNWLQEKKAAESQRINVLKKKYNQTKVEFADKNATESTRESY